MSKRTYTFLICAAIVLAFGCHQALAEAAEPAEPASTAAAEISLSIREQDAHPALMTVNSAGCFQPFSPATTEDICAGLYPMLGGLNQASARGEGLGRTLWGGNFRAAALLYNAGILAQGQTVRPGDTLKRGALAELLERLASRLSGGEAERAALLAEEVRSGATSQDGVLEPEAAVTRAELAVVLERLAAREPEEAALLLGEYVPVDVERDSDAWLYIADAVTEGAPETPTSGTYRAYGALYAVDEDGQLLRDVDYGVWSFDADGRYTTGEETLDAYIAKALEDCEADELSAEDALEELYLYVKYNYEYLVTPEDTEPEAPGATGWENTRALRFFQNGGGTCYGFAAAFGLLARAMGEEAYIVSAQVNEYYAPHGFVVIPEDGVNWIYDVEMEATRMERHSDLELFHIENFSVYSYWYTPDW